MLNAAHFSDLVELLDPCMHTEQDRRALVESIFTHASSHPDIDYGGVPLEATRRIVLALLDFGDIEPDKPALVALLEAVRSQVDADEQERIDDLIEALYQSQESVGYQVISTAGKYLFISYSRANLNFVERLRRDLQTAGVNIWIDRIGLKPGTPDWEQALRDAIAASDGILLVASPTSRRSPYVRDEIAIARMHKKPLFPIWIEGADYIDAIPMGTSYIQNVDMRGDAYPVGLTQLLTLLTEDTSTIPLPQPEVEKALNVPFNPARKPYKGLNPFREADRDIFFGRSALVKDLMEALRDARFLAIVGASGSGKSSVAMAGLLPALKQGALPNSESWCYAAPFVPGVHPLENLTIALAWHFPEKSQRSIGEDLQDPSTRGLYRLACQLCDQPQSRLVLYIDQFEELYTLTQDDSERQQFIDLITTAVTEPGGNVIVILSMRADFYDRPLNNQALGQLFQAHMQNILPMTLADLLEAVEEPAKHVGLEFDDGLVTELVFAVREEPGALPLLQFTLERLYEGREDHRLTFAAYKSLGGLRGALAQHAETTYAELPDEEHRLLARGLFLRLIEPGATEQDTTRRRAALTELQLEDAERTTRYQSVAKTFVDARLLTTDRVSDTETIEVSHEAVIREWERLGSWLKDARDDILLQKALTSDAADWQHHGCTNDRLYRGTQLAEALAWSQRNTTSADESLFLAASSRHTTVARRRQRFIRGTFVGIVLLIPLLLAAFFFDRSRREGENAAALGTQAALAGNARATSDANAATSVAAENAAIYSGARAGSEALAANAIQSFEEGNTDLAVLLAIEANQIDQPSIQARRALYRTAYHAAARYIIDLPHVMDTTGPEPGDRPSNIALTADGRKAVIYYNDALLTFDMQTGALLDRLSVDEPESGLSLPDYFTTLSVDGIWLHPDGNSIFLSTSVLGTDTDFLLQLLPGLTNSVPNTDSRPVIQLSLADGYEIHRYQREGATLFNAPLVISPDGERLYIADTTHDDPVQGYISVWDVASGQLIHTISLQDLVVQGMAITPDGAELMVFGIGAGYHTRVINLVTQQVRLDLSEHAGAVVLSNNGQTAATLNAEGLWLWDLNSGENTAVLDVPYQDWSTLTTIQFSPDDQRIAIGSMLGNITIVDTQVSQPALILKGHPGEVIRGLAFSADGQQLYTTADDHTLRAWDVEPSEALATSFIARSPASDNQVNWLALTTDGGLIGHHIDQGEYYQFNAATGEIYHRFPVPADYAWPISVSGDGEQMLFSTADYGVIVYDVPNRREVRRFATSSTAFGQAVSADQRWFLSVRFDGFDLIDVTTGARTQQMQLSMGQLTQDITLMSGAFSPDNRRILIATESGHLHEYNLHDLSLVRVFPDIIHAPIYALSYSPDGSRILTGAWDGQVTLWDAQTGELLYNFPPHRGYVVNIAFSPDGQTALSAAKVIHEGKSREELRLWRVLYDDNLMPWIHKNRAIREFTCEERILYSVQPFCGRAGYVPTRIPVVQAIVSTPVQYQIRTPLPTQPTWTPTPTPAITPTAAVSAAMGGVHSAKFSPDGSRILTNSSDAAVRLWDVNSGELLRSHAGYLTFAPGWSPDGRRYLTKNVPHIVQIWDTESGQLLATLEGHTNYINTASWNGDGSRLLTASEDRTVRIWDTESGDEVVRLGHAEPVYRAEWSPDFTRIAVVTDNNYVIVYDAASGTELTAMDAGGEMGVFGRVINYVLWSPDGSRLLITTLQDSSVWNSSTGEQVIELTGQPMALIGDWSDDGLSVVTTSFTQGNTILWDAVTGERRFQIRGKAQQPCLAQFNSDESLIYSCDGEMLSLWNTSDGSHVRDLVNASPPYNAYWSDDGRFIAAATEGGIVQIWDVETGTEVQRLGTLAELAALPTSSPTAEPTPMPPSATPNATLAAINSVRQIPLFGPAPGDLAIEPGVGSSASSGVKLMDFVARVRVTTPYDTDSGYAWHVGFQLHNNYLLLISAYEVDTTWRLFYLSITGAKPLTQGTVASWQSETDSVNQIELRVQGDSGQVIVNDQWAGDFVIAGEAEDVALITGLFQDTKPSTYLHFEDFTVYGLAPDAIFTPTNTPSGSSAAVIGENRGEFPVGGSDQWVYEGRAGEVVTLLAAADAPANGTTSDQRAGLLDSELIVYAPDGRIIAFGNDIEAGQQTDARIADLALPVSGSYIIEVFGWQRDTGGAYRLIIDSSLRPDP